MKKVLTVQDLSCVGCCSLTVALPVLSAMGCRCSVLPTGVLSTHTGFPNPHRHPLTQDIAPIAAHWKSQGVTFDAVQVGYLADVAQAEAVEGVIRDFGKTVIIDPAMGDGGRLYSGLTPEHPEAMKRLCRLGDYLLPNVTEAAILTGLPFEANPKEAYLHALGEKMLAFGAKGVVITGVTGKNGTIGFVAAEPGQGMKTYEVSCIPRQFHGTGDLFAAVFTGALVQGATLMAAAEKAAGFVEKCIAATREPTPYGVNFESQLPSLYEPSKELL